MGSNEPFPIRQITLSDLLNEEVPFTTYSYSIPEFNRGFGVCPSISNEVHLDFQTTEDKSMNPDFGCTAKDISEPCSSDICSQNDIPIAQESNMSTGKITPIHIVTDDVMSLKFLRIMQMLIYRRLQKIFVR